MKYCSNYTGITCVDGNCPIARNEDYNEYGIDVPKNCKECSDYKGCEDCAWFGTRICGEMNKYQESLNYLRMLERKERLFFTNQVAPQINCDVLQELVDKATPKKIKETDSFFLCPSCNQILETKYEGMCIDCLHKRHYCPNCGQKLDWSEDN